MQPVCNEVLLDDIDEVKIKRCVHKSKNDLFDSIPDFIDVDKPLADLQSGRHPDADDADVYC